MPKPKKDVGSTQVNRTMRIFCEGEKTEPYYINGYIDHFHSGCRTLKTIIVEDCKKNTPVQIVEAAVTHKKSGVAGDDYWVVYDREAETKYSSDLHQQAAKLAKDNGIKIGFSNVCFELWILLHLTRTSGAFTSCDNLLKCSELKAELKKLGINDYEKGLPTLFDKLKDKIKGNNGAVARAKVLKNNAINSAAKGKESPCFLNPYTDVHELFNAMEEFEKR